MTPPLVVDRHVVDDQGAALGQRVVGPLQQSLFGVPSPVVQHELSKCGRPPVAESLFPLAQLAGVGDAKTHVVEAGSHQIKRLRVVARVLLELNQGGRRSMQQDDAEPVLARNSVILFEPHHVVPHQVAHASASRAENEI